MTITEKTYRWCGILAGRSKTTHIVLHHAAGNNISADNIHNIHIKNGWVGIGYHFYIRNDGKVYRGRPLNSIGAHTSGYNSCSVGICFEGNFEKHIMPHNQLQSGRELIAYIKSVYPHAQVLKHKDLNATACPGKNFPFDKIIQNEISEVSDIIKSLNKRGIITDSNLWIQKCTLDTDAYWLCRKICNMTQNISERQNKLSVINDIVWELGYRGIITDTKLWLGRLSEDEDLYHLAYKACNRTQNKAVM